MIIRFHFWIFFENSLSETFSFNSSHQFELKSFGKVSVDIMNPTNAFNIVGGIDLIDIIS